MKISIGFSPCPNDTFIFDALVNGKIDTEGLEFEVFLEDVQTLNQWAIEKKLAVTKISYGVLPLIMKDYILCNSGSALGTGVGPLLTKHPDVNTAVEDTVISIPGENTTAHLLFSLAYPNAKQKRFVRYDEVENFVNDKLGYGVIIHENRFTYQKKGLEKIVDLGDFWEKETNNFIPLGGIVADRSLSIALQQKIDRLIKKSIVFAYENTKELTPFIKNNAQEMSEEVMRQHIQLYVNEYSIDLGNKGKEAVQKLLNVYQNIHEVAINTDELIVPLPNHL